MSKISKEVQKQRKQQKKEQETLKNNPVINYMGGISYELNPLNQLKIIATSSIFSEPQYYRKNEKDTHFNKDGFYKINEYVNNFALFNKKNCDYNEKTTSEIMIEAINKSLDFDYENTIKFAEVLRKEYNMRLNPQIIMVLAAMHEKRKDHSVLFSKINKEVMQRADEPSSQLAFYIYNYGSKRGIPSILKRNWKNKYENLTRYEVSKYKNHELGIIDTVRICHANNEIINELMKNGKIEINDDQKTWQNLKTEGKTWKEIIDANVLGHMALLRNLRNIFTELNDEDIEDKNRADMLLNKLKNGVRKGKQFPFRYYTAYKNIENSKVNFKARILDALEECIDISIENMPKLKGKTMCLSDNSGSAWGSINSEYGSVTIAEIDNLSSVITSQCSDEGYVGKFGDNLKTIPISKRNGALMQSQIISNKRYSDIGGSTENGIWLFFKQAIESKEHWDNIFIYSDQQAGHGGLYGVGKDYLIENESFKCKDQSYYSNYIDVMQLIEKYRKEVNPKVNVFCIQTAGYNNAIIPEYTYRGGILAGWTGKESLFAQKLIKIWDDIEKNNK